MLDQTQLTALKTYIDSVPEWATLPNDSTSALFISQQLDAIASPNFIVWKTSVQLEEITQNGFDWVRVDNLSVGKARIWEWMFGSEDRSINPAKTNVRAGIDEVWKGTAADLAVRAQVYVHCKRLATRAETMLGSGTGTESTPGFLSFEGEVTPTDATRVVFRDNGTIWTQE